MKHFSIFLILITIFSTFFSSTFDAQSGSGPLLPDNGGSIYLPIVMKSYILSEMIQIPGQYFWMGCTHDSNDVYGCYTDAKPIHTVYLDSYKIDKTEVTNVQYKQCVNAGICSPPGNNTSYSRFSYYNDPAYDNYPVIYVSWYDAQEFCTWAGKRLPTEAEWERAARGLDLIAYPWGNTSPSCSLANSMFLNTLEEWQYCLGDTADVNSFVTGASPEGVLNLAGNVYEWVVDWYSPDYYETSPLFDPTGPETGISKVLRGGSWAYKPRHMLTSFRISDYPDAQKANIGFRCVSQP